jgi:hypothetical protein
LLARTGAAAPWAGRLLLKPTPHAKEDEGLDEKERLRFIEGGAERERVDRAEYYDIDAVPGTLICFPSWLLHAVLPYEKGEGERISVAFNINEVRRGAGGGASEE